MEIHRKVNQFFLIVRTFIKKFEGSILPMIWSNLEVAKSIPMKVTINYLA
jgi:hypothetical protein